VKKICESCGRETDWEYLYKDERVVIIQCKECNRVEHVYGGIAHV
jgi:uncharacterized Zn finger protein